MSVSCVISARFLDHMRHYTPWKYLGHNRDVRPRGGVCVVAIDDSGRGAA